MAKAQTDTPDGPTQGEMHMKMLDELIKMYNNPQCPVDIRRQIERIAGLQPSQIHPVTSAALNSGGLHESLLNPPMPATNGKPQSGLL